MEGGSQAGVEGMGEGGKVNFELRISKSEFEVT